MTKWLFVLTAVLFAGASSPAATIDSSASAIFELDGLDTFGGGTGIATFFLNTQGDDDGFSEFGVIDFATAGTTAPILMTGQSLQLSLGITQSLAGFANAGGLEFYLAGDTAEILVEDTRTFLSSGDPTNPNIGADVVGSQFGTLFSLGAGTFTPAMTGDTDTFTFGLDSAAETFVLGQFDANAPLRVLLTPGDATVAATYSGAGSGLNPIPTLTVTAVPEPGTFAVLGLLSVVGGRTARRRERQG